MIEKNKEIIEDRKELFEYISEDLDLIEEIVCRELIYNDAKKVIRALHNVRDIIQDPIGEYIGKCEDCDDPLYYRNDGIEEAAINDEVLICFGCVKSYEE